MLGIILQVLDIEGCTCYHVYNPLTLLTLPHCQCEVTEYKFKKKRWLFGRWFFWFFFFLPVFKFQQLGCVFCNIINFPLAVVKDRNHGKFLNSERRGSHVSRE